MSQNLSDSSIYLPALKKGEKYEVGIKENQKEKLPPYILIGSGRFYESTKGVKMDAIDIISRLTKVEVSIIQYFKELLIDQDIWNHNNPTSQDRYRANVAEVPTNNLQCMSPYLKKGMSKSYKNLVEFKILIRIKRNKYMINPNFIVPSSNYKEAIEEWNNLIETKTKN